MEEAVNIKKCRNCGFEVPSTTKFCGNCGFPENSNEKNHHVYRLKMKAKKDELDKLETNLRYSSAILFIIAALQIFLGLMTEGDEQIALIAIGAIFLAIGIWSIYQKFAGILTGLILYVTLHILAAAVTPMNLFSGLIIKILIISTMIAALSGFKKAQVLKKEINFKRF